MKGIETCQVMHERIHNNTSLQCPFPFEGNWNFPPQWYHHWCHRSVPYNVLSRLKGIETLRQTAAQHHLLSLTMSFPVWRELKPKPRPKCQQGLVPLASYNVLSRLKGIETNVNATSPQTRTVNLQCPFPFEGNWNPLAPIGCDHLGLTMSFPVWRELKRNLSNLACSAGFLTYNVLSRLKGIETLQCRPLRCVGDTYNVLSRLKGIETNAVFAGDECGVMPYNVLSRLKGIETKLPRSIQA